MSQLAAPVTAPQSSNLTCGNRFAHGAQGGILAYMPMEHSPATPSPDDFDRQLRDLASGAAGAARFRELSAAEREKQAARRHPLQRMRWRSLKARKARRAPSSPEHKPGGSPRPGKPGQRRLGAASGRRFGQPAASSRQQRLRSIAKTAGVFVGFVVLLVLLHVLGFGPQ
jgi:hypothetical protein